jgi:hypothetical protein
VTMENFGDVVQTLENLAEFGNWDHSSEPPDLPAEYADAPSFPNAAATLACGIELTEIMHTIRRSRKGVTAETNLQQRHLQEVWRQDFYGMMSCPRTFSRASCRTTASGLVTQVRSRPTGSSSTYEAGEFYP